MRLLSYEIPVIFSSRTDSKNEKINAQMIRCDIRSCHVHMIFVKSFCLLCSSTCAGNPDGQMQSMKVID